MFQLIFVFLLSICAVTLTENNQDFEITAADLKKAEENIKTYIQGMLQQIKSMPKDKVAELKKMLAQITEQELDNNPLEKFFFDVWYTKNKQVFSEEEQKQYEDAWKKGELKGMSEDENNVFSIIELSNGKRYIIPTNLMYGFAELMMQRIPQAFESLNIKIEKESDITGEVLEKVFNKIAQDSGVEALLYDMLFMHTFQRSSQKWQQAIFKNIK